MSRGKLVVTFQIERTVELRDPSLIEQHLLGDDEQLADLMDLWMLRHERELFALDCEGQRTTVRDWKVEHDPELPPLSAAVVNNVGPNAMGGVRADSTQTTVEVA